MPKTKTTQPAAKPAPRPAPIHGAPAPEKLEELRLAEASIPRLSARAKPLAEGYLYPKTTTQIAYHESGHAFNAARRYVGPAVDQPEPSTTD